MFNIETLPPRSVNTYTCNLISKLSPIFKNHPNKGICKLDYSGIGISIKSSRVKDVNKIWMNFQQLQFDPQCHLYIFVGYFPNSIRYWLFKPEELKSAVSKQHPGGIEFQFGITNKNIQSLSVNEFQENDIIPYLNRFNIN